MYGIRLGLCCKFLEEPISFRTTTAASLSRLSDADASEKLESIAVHNSEMLFKSLEYCSANNIGCFRINSQILPLKTHPDFGYELSDLTSIDAIQKKLCQCKEFANKNNLRMAFHPDQFVVLNSPKPDVVERSIEELAYQAEVAEICGVDVINVHGGGGYGNKPEALDRLKETLLGLPESIKRYLTLENDDRTFTPSDLLPVCESTGSPLVYDVHHHRCNPDELSIKQATQKAIATWNREPLFHISSPKESWDGKTPRPHSDFIDPADFPVEWFDFSGTVEVEAKSKELAVKALQKFLKEKTCYGKD